MAVATLKLYTLKEVCDRLGIQAHVLTYLFRNNTIKRCEFTEVGNRVYYTDADIKRIHRIVFQTI